MRIGVVSDTHVPSAARELPAALLRGLAGVDMILHAGDLVSRDVLCELERIAEVRAVHGNMDYPDVKRALPTKRVVEVGGRRIGLIHGSRDPHTLMDRVRHAFTDEAVDVIVFGHSHQPVNEEHGGVLFFNPGSPTDRRFTESHSYGILALGERIEGEIVRLD